MKFTIVYTSKYEIRLKIVKQPKVILVIVILLVIVNRCMFILYIVVKAQNEVTVSIDN